MWHPTSGYCCLLPQSSPLSRCGRSGGSLRSSFGVRGTEVRYEHVIVGGGLAGGMVAQEFREQGGDGSVLIVAREAHTPYHRPPLTKGYLRGEAGPDEVFMHPDEWWKQQSVDVRTGTEATAIDT